MSKQCYCVCLSVVSVQSPLEHVADVIKCDIHGLLCAVMVINTSEDMVRGETTYTSC